MAISLSPSLPLQKNTGFGACFVGKCNPSSTKGARRMRKPQERGFVLPLSVLLVIVLTISGMGFLQHDYLERRMTSNNVDNHAAFYLANAGLERARAVAHMEEKNGKTSWSPILQGDNPSYEVRNEPQDVFDDRLCERYPCVVLPFGPLVRAQDSPSNPPFNTEFSRGEYAVRAYNNMEEAQGNEDVDQYLTFRSLGLVGNELKVVEATVSPASTLRLINCGYPGTPSPDAVCPATTCPLCIDPIDEDHAPKAFNSAQLPTPNEAFYNSASHFPWATQRDCPPSGEFQESTILNNSYYFCDTDVTVNSGVDAAGVVIISTKTITLNQSVQLRSVPGVSGSTLFASGNVQIDRSVQLQSLLPFPAVVSLSGTMQIDQGGWIRGAVYAAGDINVERGERVTGVIVAHGSIVTPQDVGMVNVLGTNARVDDQENLEYYKPIRGFNYPSEQGSGIVFGSWRELE